jgi:hypothetical protein
VTCVTVCCVRHSQAVFNYEFDSLTHDDPVIQAVYTALREAEYRSTGGDRRVCCRGRGGGGEGAVLGPLFLFVYKNVDGSFGWDCMLNEGIQLGSYGWCMHSSAGGRLPQHRWGADMRRGVR